MKPPRAAAAPRPDDPSATQIFLSYSRRDTEVARRLFEALAARGLQTWVDWEDIPPSADWWREIEQAIEGAQAVVLLLGPASIASTVCRREIAHALAQHKRLIPVVVEELDATTVDGLARDEVGAAIGRLNWIHARAGDDFDLAVTRLHEAVVTDLDWVRRHSRLLQAAIEWQQRRRRGSLLLRGSELDEAEAWLVAGALKAPGPTALQTEFIVASRLGAVSRRRRLWGGVAVAGLLVTAASLVASFQAATAELRRDEAGSRRLAALVPAAIEGDDLALALLLGTHAHDTHPTAEAANALMQALEVMRGRRAVPVQRFAVDGPLEWSADGRWLRLQPCAATATPPDCEPGPDAWLDTTTLQLREADPNPSPAPSPGPRWQLEFDEGGPGGAASARWRPGPGAPSATSEPPLSVRLPAGALQAVAVAPQAPRAAVVNCAIRASGRHCDGQLHLIDLQSGRLLGAAVSSEQDVDPLLSASFLDDRWLVTGGCGASSPSEACLFGQTRLWQADGAEGLVASGAGLRTAGGAVARIERSADGRQFATLGALGTLSLWKVSHEALETTGAFASVLEIERLPAAPSRTVCRGVELAHPLLQPARLGLADAAPLCTALAGFDLEQPLAMAWAPEAARLAIGGCAVAAASTACRPGRILVLQQVDGRLEPLPAWQVDGEVTALAYSADGSRLVVAHCASRGLRDCTDGATLTAADLRSGERRSLATGLPGISALALDAAGERLAHASCHEFPTSGPPVDACATAAIRLLPLDGAALPVRELGGPQATVSSLAFTPDGERLVAGDSDGGLSFWDLDAGYRIGPPLDWHHQPVEALDFDPAQHLLAHTADGASRWLARPADWTRLACRLAGRDLSPVERRRWIGSDAAGPAACTPGGEAVGPPDRSAWSRAWRQLVLRFEERRAAGG